MVGLLTIEDLRVSFDLPQGRLDAVRGVSFSVPEGGTVALVGESGSGKSVITQAIMGILPRPASIKGGRILFSDPRNDGKTVDIAQLDRDGDAMRSIRGGRSSIIFQEPLTALSPVHPVGNQSGAALELHRGAAGAEGKEIIEDMLRMVGFPDPQRAIRTYPFELSGGLRQRAVIAMGLICRPSLMIADEPTTALDVTIQAQILKLIGDLQQELGMAMLLITHDLGVVANVAKEVVVLYRGEVMERGGVEDIYRNPHHPYLKALLKAVPRFNMGRDERLVPLREIQHEGPSQLLSAKEPWPEDADKSLPLLSVEGVTKGFTIRKSGWFSGTSESSVLAVDDVSFAIARGECLGLVGESGCGKTTLSKLILRALTPDSGEITFSNRGKPLNVLELQGQTLVDFRTRIQFVFQDPYGSLNPRMTVFDIISEPLVIHGIGDEASRREMVKELMRVVGLDIRFLNRYPHSFSGGQRQRIGIARALALKPDLLICDEPVSALDVSIQAQILNLLKDLRSELGLTYLFISHNLAVVDYVADRIAVMCRGRLVELAPREALFTSPVHPYTRALLAAVPEPSLDHPLDFSSLMDERASEPFLWPAPFTINRDARPRLVDLGEGHFVRADPERGPIRAAA